EVSAGKLELRFLDPEPYSEAEDAARASGLARVVADQAGGTITFGLIGRNSVDREETIPFLDPQTDSFLEYDVMRMVQSLAAAKRPKIAMVSGAPMEGEFDPMNPGRQAPSWFIVTQLRQIFEVESVLANASALPEDTAVLFLAHPRNLSEELLRAIDAYALAGGSILALIDPWCEAAPSSEAQMSSFGGPQQGGPSSSDLGPLLAAWGVSWEAKEFVADRKAAMRVPTRSDGRGSGSVEFLAYHQVLAENEVFAKDDPLTQGLEILLLGVPGSFRSAEGATTRLIPLLRSTDDSAVMPTSKLEFMPDPGELLREFVPSGGARVLAARLEGTLQSAFPDEGGVTASGPAGGIVLVGDLDFLADRFWVDTRPMQLGMAPVAMTDNGSFILNVIEGLSGSGELMSLRSRGKHTRPFSRVEELRKEAEERYLEEESALQAKISGAEQRIRELQGQGGGDVILTPEIESELDSLNDEVLSARKELRAVEYNLRKDIDGLGREVMLLNVVGTPLLVALLVLGWTYFRNRKR
ncbi:MAG: Gldg family protein, partial [Planctomycetota bacterium]|nr:Gldg family protein [Planctomycetota bacterium]